MDEPERPAALKRLVLREGNVSSISQNPQEITWLGRRWSSWIKLDGALAPREPKILSSNYVAARRRDGRWGATGSERLAATYNRSSSPGRSGILCPFRQARRCLASVRNLPPLESIPHGVPLLQGLVPESPCMTTWPGSCGQPSPVGPDNREQGHQ